MNNARNNILARLNAKKHSGCKLFDADLTSHSNAFADEKVHRFIKCMKKTHTEVHEATHETWLNTLESICLSKGLKNLLLSPATHCGKAILRQSGRFPTLRYYDQTIETWKQQLFDDVDAAFTGTKGGIAETGTLVLWPDELEPRLMSLVPPVHIALLEKNNIYSTFNEAIKMQGWAENGMPSNVLLISGPSKSADIEQTLVYGIHGPKNLVVILI